MRYIVIGMIYALYHANNNLNLNTIMKYLTLKRSENTNDLWGDFESFFNTPSPFIPSFNSLFDWGSHTFRPALDLFEDEDSYYAQAELPGFSRKEIQVELQRDRLIFKGRRKLDDKKESSEVSFHRSITIPDSIKGEKISAKYENGVLTVMIPKAEDAKPLKIEVKN